MYISKGLIGACWLNLAPGIKLKDTLALGLWLLNFETHTFWTFDLWTMWTPLKGVADNILYFTYCQITPGKDQNQQ